MTLGTLGKRLQAGAEVYVAGKRVLLVSAASALRFNNRGGITIP